MLRYLALILCLSSSALLAKDKILIVVTNHAELGATGKQTGFYLSEVAHPHKVFTDKGFEVVLASPKGGFSPADPKSLKEPDEVSKDFSKAHMAKKAARIGIPETLALTKAEPADYLGIFFAGGHGAMWDFPNDESLKSITAELFESGKAVGAVCHGPAALINIKLSNGTHLLDGRRVCGFTNAEEEAVGLTKVVPFLLETKLKEAGGKFEGSPKNFSTKAVRDGNLITGQNPASATQTAELFVEALEESAPR